MHITKELPNPQKGSLTRPRLYHHNVAFCSNRHSKNSMALHTYTPFFSTNLDVIWPEINIEIIATEFFDPGICLFFFLFLVYIYRIPLNGFEGAKFIFCENNSLSFFSEVLQNGNVCVSKLFAYTAKEGLPNYTIYPGHKWVGQRAPEIYQILNRYTQDFRTKDILKIDIQTVQHGYRTS